MSSIELLPDTAALSRSDAWATSHAKTQVLYRLETEIEADVLCRVLNLFAMQYLVPLRVSAQQQRDTLSIEVKLADVTWHRAQVIAEKMRNLVPVLSVALEAVEPAHDQTFMPLQSCG